MAAPTPNKKSFEFRMSKKVAELTQVVHMLFTRNHEKEVEIESLKESYEYEIECIMKDARSKIEAAEKRIRELEKQISNGNTQIQTQLSELIAKKEAEWKKRNEELEQVVKNEKKEAQNCRDLLIQAQKDIEKLRHEQTNEISRMTRDVGDKTKEIDRLKAIIRTLEVNLTDKQQKASSANDLTKHVDALRKELEKLTEQCRSYERAKEQTISKNKKLESEISNLKRELNKKGSEKNSQGPPATAQKQERDPNYNEELEKMRKEIQRYRMELSNRETNFNRMFSEKNPVQVDAGAVRSSKNQMMQQAFENGVVMRIARNKSNLTGLDLHREKTLASPSRENSQRERGSDLAEDHYDFPPAITPRSNNSAVYQQGLPQNRLPHIQNNATDSRSRLQKLVKPKPLPKEMVSTKTH